MIKPSFPMRTKNMIRIKKYILALIAAIFGCFSLFFFALFFMDAENIFLNLFTPSDTIVIKAEPIPRTEEFIKNLFIDENLIYTAKGDYIEADVKADSMPYTEDGFVYLSALHRNKPDERLLLKFQEGLADVKYGDVYRIQGRIHRLIHDGGKIYLATVAEKITESDYSAFLDADKVVEMNRTVKNKGFDITLKKAEFTSDETRLYIRIENNTGKPVNFFKSYARLSHYSTFYGPLNNPNPDYPALPDTVLNGQTAEGILVMKKVNLKHPWVKLVLDGEIEGLEGQALQNNSFTFRIPLK